MWFQPLLVAAGVLMLAPVTLRRAPPELLPWMAGLLAAVGAASLLAWWIADRLQGRHRTIAGWVTVGTAAITLVVVTAGAIPDQPQHALPFAAGVAVTVAPARRARLRLPFQFTLVAAMGALLVAAGHQLLDVAVAVFLLGFVAWLAGVLAQSLLDARHRQLAARAEAQRRAELLAAVQDLSARGAAEAARRAVDSLRSLGFAVAGVSVVRDNRLAPLAVDGIPPVRELAVGEGLGGRAVAEDRVLISDDYARDARRIPEPLAIGASVAVPIRVEGRPVGVVLAGRTEAGELPPADLEVAEVIALHLGGVLETERRLDRQREVLARMQALDTMRQRLVTEVSEEVRDPLTVVRGISETLVTHGERIPDGRRQQLLHRFVEQTGALRATIDTLLDFSRLHASRPRPTLGLHPVGDVVRPAFEDVPVDGDLDEVVGTDPVMLVRALETLRGIGAPRAVRVEGRDEQVRVRVELASPTAAPRAGLLLGLAERLVVGVGGQLLQDTGGIDLLLPRQVVELDELQP